MTEDRPTKGRRVKTELKSVGVSLPDDVLEWLDRQAEARRITRSLLLRLIIEWAKEHWEARRLTLP